MVRSFVFFPVLAITGRTRQGVSSAKTRIDVLVTTARQKTPITHFVSLPLNSKAIMERFGEFKEQVLSQCSQVSSTIHNPWVIVEYLLSLLCTSLWELNVQQIVPLRSRRTIARDDDFPRSRKTDGKRGINHWKRKTYFQTEKHGNVLLTTCCTEICNKSYQIQRRKKKAHLFSH